MKTSDPYAEAYAKAARATERCQYHTPTGRQCACLIQDPQSKFCPRHSESPSTDTHNFADLLAESAEDFQTPEGINHSLAHLFRLLAGGHISTRRATGLAYIAPACSFAPSRISAKPLLPPTPAYLPGAA